MNSIDHIKTNGCRRRELQEHLDGTLDHQRENALSDHLAGCSVCRYELNLQKQIINGIESAFREETRVPHDFSRVVTAMAENQVGGLRTRRECKTSLLILLGFAVAGFLMIGVNISVTSAAFDAITSKLVAVGSYIIQLTSDIAFGFGVIARTIASRFGGNESFFLFPIIILVIALISFFLYRHYFRGSIRERSEPLKG